MNLPIGPVVENGVVRFDVTCSTPRLLFVVWTSRFLSDTAHMSEPDISRCDLTSDTTDASGGNQSKEWGAMEPLGNLVTTTHYVDENPLMTGRYLAGILHFVKHVSLIWNHRTLNWYSEKTMTTTATNMEAADFGSEMTTADFGLEMTAAQICVNLQYLGVQF